MPGLRAGDSDRPGQPAGEARWGSQQQGPLLAPLSDTLFNQLQNAGATQHLGRGGGEHE